MKNRFLVVIILINTVLVSCIPYKDTIYFQNKSKATDSTQVVVELQKPYRVQINDILNIRIKVTDQDNVQNQVQRIQKQSVRCNNSLV